MGFWNFYLVPGSLSDFWGRLLSDLLNGPKLCEGKNCVCQNRQPKLLGESFPPVVAIFPAALLCFGLAFLLLVFDCSAALAAI